MKKITLIISLLGVFIVVNAQTEKEYNPYRYDERKAATGQIRAEQYQEFFAKRCDTLQFRELIEGYNTTKSIQYLNAIRSHNCSEAIDYAIGLINTSPDKEARKIAIEMLGFRRYYDVIPLLLSHVKQDISSDEKIVIAKTLAILDKKTEALEVLDCNCYNLDDMVNNCTSTYLDFYDKATALKYFEHYFNKPETQLEAASWLAGFGIYDKTFPLFVEFLENNTSYSRGIVYSLGGLAAIGTEEAIDIIKQQTKNNTPLIARTATLILENLMKERSEKCKD